MFTLMNKDVPLLDFIIEGTGSMEYCKPIKEYVTLPSWFGDINEWVTNRSVAKHRKHIQDILDQCNGKTPSGFIMLTHCLSLNDTLWVKPSEEDLVWDKVSLYKNNFNDIISKLSFDGSGLCGIQMSTTSPELTTDGVFDKCWVRDANGIYLMKVGSSGASNAGLEPYNEVLASAIFEVLCTDSTVYTLSKYRSHTVSKCELFTSEKYGFKSMSVYGLKSTSLPDVLRTVDRYCDVDKLRCLLIGDSVTVNPDRHLGNIGFKIDNETFDIIDMAPAFDFNRALFPYADWCEGLDDLDKWIKLHGPIIGPDYYSVAEDLMTPAIRAKLINLKDLELDIETDSKFSKERLGVINKFKNIQIDRLLGHRVQFSFTEYNALNLLYKAGNAADV